MRPLFFLLLFVFLCVPWCATTVPMQPTLPEAPQAIHEQVPAAEVANPAPPVHDAVVPDASKPRVALLHMHDGVWFFARLGSLTLKNKQRYSARWGYDMVSAVPGNTSGVLRAVACTNGKDGCYEPDPAFDIDHGRAPTFGKIKLALAACVSRPDYWLLWSDADAMVVNQTVPLESIIDDGYDLIFAYDWLMLNAGMLLMKCTPWTTQFLTSVYAARSFDKARALDQSALQDHLDKLPKAEYQQHVKVIPKYAMNVYLEEYRPGDFLMHMAGKLYEATEQGLWAIARQFDSISHIDNIDDIRAFFDTRYLLNMYSGTCDRRTGGNECKPDDPRRIKLNATLGSMSTPKRYHHVALRYYFLQTWEDKYDVPGWNAKRKALPTNVDRAPPSEHQIVADELAQLAARKQQPAPAAAAAPEQKKTSIDDEDDSGGDKDEPVSLDAVQKALAQDNKLPKAEMKGDGDEDDDAAESASNFGVKLLVFGLFAVAGSGGVLLYRKRRRAIKVQ